MAKKNLSKELLKHPEYYEFGGKFGVTSIMVGLPALVYILFLASQKDFHVTFGATDEVFQELFRLINEACSDWTVKDQLYAFGAMVAWFGFQSLLSVTLPGRIVDGVVIANGDRLKYKLNGNLAFWVTFSASLAFWHQCFSRLYDFYFHLITASILSSWILSLGLYVVSFRRGSLELSSNISTSKSTLYNFFIGRELNPRVGKLFDLKFFCELRPGLMGWVFLNGGMLAKQYETSGFVSSSMLLVTFCQGFYVWDSLYNEQAILTMMDITHDGFGWMLVFGDLTWVPFTYGLQARYLVHNQPNLGSWTLLFIVVLHFVGYAIFRGSNSEKNNFRSDTNGNQKWKYMTTKSGSKLLISGWWGLARKVNYTGDLIMGLSWCLFCGLESIVPYFYFIYFTVLLIHRARRDDALCLRKYGQDWTKYKELVPYIFIPYIY